MRRNRRAARRVYFSDMAMSVVYCRACADAIEHGPTLEKLRAESVERIEEQGNPRRFDQTRPQPVSQEKRRK